MIFVGNILIFIHASHCATLGSQQYVVEGSGSSASGSLEEIIVAVNSDGSPSAFSPDPALSCIVSAGCFAPQSGIRPTVVDILSDNTLSYDPLLCFTLCSSLNQKFAAVNGAHCACSSTLTAVFTFASSVTSCDIACTSPTFSSRICGGTADFWNLFMCYTYEQIVSLVVDPWRNIAFKTVSINWYKEDGLPYGTLFPPETYYLFAHDVSSGTSLLQYHVKQTDPNGSYSSNMLYTGLSFDVDSSRIVGLMVPASIGSFTYRLLIITIDASDLLVPIMSVTALAMSSGTVSDIFGPGGSETDAGNFFLANKVSGMVSKNGLDTYVFASTYGITGNDPATALSKLIFVDLFSVLGRVFFTAPLDCVVTQLAINEYYGDVGILAPRQGAIQFIAIATVYQDPRTGMLSATPYWDPSGLNPVFVAAVQDTQSLNLLAGVTVSIPLQNKSCQGIMLYSSVNGAQYTDDRQLLLNQPVLPSDVHNNSVPSVLCFDIRNMGFLQLWGSYNGTARTIDNGTVSPAITMDLYQQDPGFPMTLSRPVMVSCQLSPSALAVSVKFDSVTLMGATAVDTNNTGIPDEVDLSTQVLSPVSAVTCFGNSSSLVAATCYFTAPDLLLLTLDQQLSTLTFGNALCLQPHFVWRHVGTDWSTYATGCCTVTAPPNLAVPKPVLVVTPALTIDVCSGVTLDLTDSVNCGRGCTFSWNLASIQDIATVTGVGAVTNGANVLAQFQIGINSILSSAANSSVSFFSIPSAMMAKNAYHYFAVTLVSSWQLSFVAQFTVVKLGQSAPTVSISGDQRLVETQISDYFLTAVGQASSCANTGGVAPSIGYNWTYSNCSVSLSASNIISNQNIVHIPPHTHVCSPTAGWFDSSINQVVCEQCIASVSVFLLSAPLKTSVQSVTIQIVRSAILAQCYNPNFSLVTRGPVMFVNCANSIDLDYPQSTTFQPNFGFACLTSALLPCFGSGSPVLANMATCVTDYTQPSIVGDGGILYPQVLFNATQGFCRMGRGITAINTNLLSDGTFSIQVNVSDTFRLSTTTFSVQLTDLTMPTLNLAILGSASVLGTYPISSSMQLAGTSSLSTTVAASQVGFAWSLFSQQLNPAYSQVLATTAINNGQIYATPQYVYQPTTTLAACEAAGTAAWTAVSPTIAILPFCLSPDTSYTIRLNMTWTQAVSGNPVTLSTYSELQFATAGGPPTKGQFTVAPVDANFPTCDYDQTLSAANWISNETPLSYRFGYIVNTTLSLAAASATTTTVAKYWYQDVAQPTRSFSGLIPCGVVSNDYTVTVFVEIITNSGEFVFSFLQVRSYPPSNPVAAAQNIIASANSAYVSDPASAIQQYMTAISLTTTATASDQTSIMNDIVTTVGQTQCSSSDCGDRQLTLLNTLASVVTSAGSPLSSVVQETIITAIEANTARIVAASSTSGTVSSAQSQTIFSSISTLIGAFVSNTSAASISTAANVSPFSAMMKVTQPTSSSGGRVLRNNFVDIELSCVSVHCDVVGTFCYKPVLQINRQSDHYLLVCCSGENPATNCVDPPCWFLKKCNLPPQTSSIRRLDVSIPTPTSSSFDDLITAVQTAEQGPYLDSIALQATADQAALDAQLAIAAEEAYLNSLSADLQAVLRAQWEASLEEGWAIANATAYNASQLFSRIVAARDAIAQAIIPTLIRNQAPLVFDTNQFRIYIGKTTDMSGALPQFTFPSEYTVPPNSPDNPTANNPVTGFSFSFVEYYSNVYAWALNAPVSADATIASISVMRANPALPLVISASADPIRIFVDQDIFASAKCLWWNRLAPLSGGGWTVQKSINDGTGCLISQPGDVGMFIDGELINQNNTAGISPPKTSLFTLQPPRFLIVAMGGCFLLIVLVFALWALRIDNTLPSTNIVYDGDGISTPLSVNDPIAYSQRDEGITIFIMATLWNTLKLKHAFLSCIFTCDPLYTKFQKVLALSAMVIGVMLFASVLVRPGAGNNAGSLGFTASLMSYPVYFLFQWFFRARLTQLRISKKPEHIPLTELKELKEPSSEPFPGVRALPTLLPFIGNSPFVPSAGVMALPSSARSAGVTPPPPLEDAPSFIKRVRDVYESKVLKEQTRESLMASSRANKIVPDWAIVLSTILPFAMYFGFVILAAVIVIVSSMDYDIGLEAVWFVAVGTGLVCELGFFDLFNCTVSTLIELRKHEMRRRSVGGTRKVLPPPPARPRRPVSPFVSSESSSLGPPPTPRMDQNDITLGSGLGAMMPDVFVSQPPTPVSAKSGSLLPGRMHRNAPPPPMPPPPM